MHWINLRITTLRSPAFIGSEPVSRATWLAVLAYCCEQENGGIVSDCADWKDRQWQQTCGVTREEIDGASKLLEWDGNDLIVWEYPVEKQREIEVRREAGRKGGQSKSEAKVAAVRANGAKHIQSETKAEPKLNLSSNLTEREREEEREGERNGKEKEKKTRSAEASAPADDATWLADLGKDSAYAGIDVAREFAKMANWCSAHNRQPTRRRFVNWLNRIDRPLQTNAQPTLRTNKHQLTAPSAEDHDKGFFDGT